MFEKTLLVELPFLLEENGNTAIIPSKIKLPSGPAYIAAHLKAETGSLPHYLNLVFSKNIEKEVKRVALSMRGLLIPIHTARNVGVAKRVLELFWKHGFRGFVSVGGNVTDVNTGLGVNELNQLGIPATTVVRGYGHSSEAIHAILGGVQRDVVTKASPKMLVPDFSMIPGSIMERYRKISSGRASCVLSFGCVYKCTYCAAVASAPLILREIADVLAEIRLLKKLGYSHISFADNIILHSKCIPSLVEAARLCKQLGMTFSGMTRMEDVVGEKSIVTQQLLAQLQSYGLTEIAFAIETASQGQLDEYRRGVKEGFLEQVLKAFEMIREAQIDATIFIMLDNPLDTNESMWKLWEHIKKMKGCRPSWTFTIPTAREGLIDRGLEPSQLGFYNWPLGLSSITQERTVQWAMAYSLVGQMGAKPERLKFFNDGKKFGIHLDKWAVWQKPYWRSPIGNIFETWKIKPH